MQRHKSLSLAVAVLAALVLGACGSIEIPTKKVD